MRFVVYDDEDMEPITVIVLRGITERDIEAHGRRYRMCVPKPFPMYSSTEPVFPDVIDVVNLFFEPFVRIRQDGHRQYSWMCFTKATQLALSLNADWLPGQKSAIAFLQQENKNLVELFMKILEE